MNISDLIIDEEFESVIPPLTDEEFEEAKSVKECGYNGRLSLEGGYQPEFNECIIRMRKILKAFE